MFQRSILILCLLALSAPAPAASRRAAKKAKLAETELSPGLAKPVEAALESLQSLQSAPKAKHSAAIRQADSLKADLKATLGQVREAKVEKDEAAAKDGAVVAVAAALRAADLVSQGLQEGDDDQVQAGLKLGNLAQTDLQRLEDQGAGASSAGGEAASTYKIGPSIGGDFSVVGQSGSENLSLDLSASFPVTAAMDLGVGGSLTGNTSSSSGSDSTGLGYGINGFARYHFLQLFSRAPWIVPYLGLKLGLNLSNSFSTSGYTVTETDTTTTSLGEQLGILFFLSAKSAITLQLENDVNSSTSNGTSSPSTDSFTLSVGVRQMF